MGVAEVIPGISGGTLALILGIYERLINAISSFNLDLISLLKDKRIFEAWDQVDGTFITLLVIGMLTSIFIFSSLILFFMEEYPFFFKSFLSSILLYSAFLEPLKPKMSARFLLGLTLSICICSFLYLLPSREFVDINLLYLFFSGFIAVTALIIPGISGSFILLLLGTYTTMLMAVRDLNFYLIFIFLLGSIIGLFVTVRFIKFLYEKERHLLLSIFFGLVIFCIPLIWINETSNSTTDFKFLSVAIGGALGFLLIFLFKKITRN
ncbi:DUF368 domain-containing protein [SAR86 cluster bacterium]|nr:DUF368 domain-containing protein [SAR86 cluster bacterium]